VTPHGVQLFAEAVNQHGYVASLWIPRHLFEEELEEWLNAVDVL